MENIPLATAIITIFAIPGYIARISYFSGELTAAILPKRILSDLITAILLSFPLHGLIIALWEIFHHFGMNCSLPITIPDINFVNVFRIFSGNFEAEGPQSINQIIPSVESNSIWGLLYGLLVIGLAVSCGWGLRRKVWDYKLDLKYPAIFKFENFWLYWLTGRSIIRDETNDTPGTKIITTIDAMVEHEGKTRLYKGIWFDFTTTQTGDLENLFLLNGRRWSNKKDDNGNYKGWVDIPGNVLVLKSSNVKNINISYFLFEPETKSLNYLEGVEIDP